MSYETQLFFLQKLFVELEIPFSVTAGFEVNLDWQYPALVGGDLIFQKLCNRIWYPCKNLYNNFLM